MGRPKSYRRDAVLVAARDLFWERGYEATSIADLERHTGLNRSSLYQEFGSKHSLFEEALTCYLDTVIARLFDGLRGSSAALGEIAGLFRRLGELFRSGSPVAARGCLIVNTAAELGARDPAARSAAVAYRDRVRADFAAALNRSAVRGQIPAATVTMRSHLLTATLMGIWLAVRIDPADAAALCDLTARQVSAWREAPGDATGS